MQRQAEITTIDDAVIDIVVAEAVQRAAQLQIELVAPCAKRIHADRDVRVRNRLADIEGEGGERVDVCDGDAPRRRAAWGRVLAHFDLLPRSTPPARGILCCLGCIRTSFCVQSATAAAGEHVVPATVAWRRAER